ncbi:hypothetical protein [Micromonospora sp. RP3T]|uniref:hypothetical protein n=1 Tax=Micromonospora sp. RP3T TaxID=2135446 RepID=UPI000D17A04B|nr:hypothetical protein [Micromonospora sp. RP3T]PTA47579.1 hypothetical protein C8054_04160 [Micromonospora sp. RP3T]
MTGRPRTTTQVRHQQRDGINPPVHDSPAAAMKGKPRLDFAPAPANLTGWGAPSTSPWWRWSGAPRTVAARAG